MLYPKKVKFRKWQKNRQNPKGLSPETRGTDVNFGLYGFKAVSYDHITSNQLEAARKVISRTLGKAGRIWIRVFPDRPITKKAAEVPMGKGKGDPQGFCVEIRPGRVIFEVDGVTEEVAKEALRKGGTKLPVKGKVISRAH